MGMEGEAEAKIVAREVIGRAFDGSIGRLGDDMDLFEFGLDSLQSARIRNVVQRVCVCMSLFTLRLMRHFSRG